MLLEVIRITTTSRIIENSTTRPSFQLYITSSQAQTMGLRMRTRA